MPWAGPQGSILGMILPFYRWRNRGPGKAATPLLSSSAGVVHPDQCTGRLRVCLHGLRSLPPPASVSTPTPSPALSPGSALGGPLGQCHHFPKPLRNIGGRLSLQRLVLASSKMLPQPILQPLCSTADPHPDLLWGLCSCAPLPHACLPRTLIPQCPCHLVPKIASIWKRPGPPGLPGPV